MANNYELLRDYLVDCYIRLKGYCDDGHWVADGILDQAAKNLLRPVNFTDIDNLPQYGEEPVQDLYCIRYLYAYAYEYREMFRRLLEQQAGNLTEMNILSIGCGTGVDLWGACEAQAMMRRKYGVERDIEYTGLDLADWNHKWGDEARLPGVAAHYQTGETEGDAVRYLEDHQEDLRQNIFVFPKSITEIAKDSDVLSRMFHAFANAKFDPDFDKIHFLVSFPYGREIDNEGNYEWVKDRLTEAMGINGYSLESEEAAEIQFGSDDAIGWLEWKHCSDPDMGAYYGGARAFYNSFRFTYEFYKTGDENDSDQKKYYKGYERIDEEEGFTDLLAKLVDDRDANKDDAEKNNIYNPAWYASHICYQVITFVRGEQV